ncbi:hypothetical protein ACFFQW_46205 [Umezawaea endophytica]|uniref:Uncharacterized protein n=1 Tax=Umezawaea endophytica TaxID=1654476 RepID=A0A9X3A696_9PSEU|nr:hypothetical protein [Umezawaea endophytica]MCS7484574.1 hypothetical protein [Umezawaea endophytica]
MANSFWDGPEGQEIRWRRRWLRVRRLHLDGEPEQKGQRGGRYRTAAAQRGLVDQLAAFSHGHLTGPVVLDVQFYSGRTQPPGPHKLAKHLLDVLGAVRADTRLPGRRHVLYRDDRQVKLLHVTLWTSPPGQSDPSTPHTAITARPLRDVVADLDLVRTVDEWDNRYGDHDDDSPLTIPPIPDLDHEQTFDPSFAAGLEQAEDRRRLNTTLAALDHGRLQQALLSRTDALLSRMLSNSSDWISGARPRLRPYSDHPGLNQAYAELDRTIADSRELLLSGPITLPLPQLPQVRGQGAEFAAAVHRAIEEITSRQPVFAPLCVPLKVILLVIPPDQGKDLDNLALQVLPVVEQVLRPPSINSYEVIELTRTPVDPPAGLMRLGLGDGHDPRSTWKQVTDYVERRMERR